MKLYGVPYHNLIDIVNRVSVCDYADNLEIRDATDRSNRSGPRVQFSIKARDSRGKGARWSASGRRQPVACWHAYRDVLQAIFDAYPSARATTVFADYRGRESFQALFPDTYWTNAGSVMEPATFGELCECDGGDPSDRKRGARPTPAAMPRPGHHTTAEPATHHNWDAEPFDEWLARQ